MRVRANAIQRYHVRSPWVSTRIGLAHFVSHNIVVKPVDIRYLVQLMPRKVLALCDRLLRRKVVGKPRIGAARGEFVVPDSFFQPLPDEILKAFSNK
jgi:hypothetical protein